EPVPQSNQTRDEVSAAVAAARAGGAALELMDTRGRRVVVPTGSLGYVEIGSEDQRRIGFGTIRRYPPPRSAARRSGPRRPADPTVWHMLYLAGAQASTLTTTDN